MAQKRRSRALLACKTQPAAEQPVDKPLESDRHLVELAMQLAGDTVDDAAAHYRFAYCYVSTPAGPVREQIVHAYGQIVVGTQQSCTLCNDAVPVVVRVAVESHVKLFFESDQAAHRIRRRWVHADAAIPIERHEPESRVDRLVHDGEVEAIALGNGMPVMDAGAAQGVDTELEPGVPDRVQIEHVLEV